MSLHSLAGIPEGVDARQYLHAQHKARQARLHPPVVMRLPPPPEPKPKEASPPPPSPVIAPVIEVAIPPEDAEEPETKVRIVPMRRIIGVVCAAYGIEPNDVLSLRRANRFVRARWLAVALASKLTTRSSVEIGRLLGGRDHSTILYARKQIEHLVEIDANLVEQLQLLTAACRGEIDVPRLLMPFSFPARRRGTFIHKPRWSSEEDEALRVLAAAGKTKAMVAAALGKTYGQVKHRAKYIGVPFKNGPAMRAAWPAAA